LPRTLFLTLTMLTTACIGASSEAPAPVIVGCPPWPVGGPAVQAEISAIPKENRVALDNWRQRLFRFKQLCDVIEDKARG
jgi:hypothetical protein